MYVTVLGASAACILSLIVIRRYKICKWGTCKNMRSMKNKTVVITGANSGLGKATALELAKHGAKVILACRDIVKAQKALIDIRSQAKNGILRIMELDLASFESIKKFAQEFLLSEDRLDVLINNAGVFMCPYELTKDGYEMTLGVNHLGHFLLTKLLLESLKQSSPSRIVIVSSAYYKKGFIDFENINMTKDNYDDKMAYKNTKLANVLFCKELSKRLQGTGVSTYAVSPGFVWTNLGRHTPMKWLKFIVFAPILWLYLRTPFQGCQTILHCAASEAVEGESGLFYQNCKVEPFANNAQDDDVAKKLWDVSETFCRKSN